MFSKITIYLILFSLIVSCNPNIGNKLETPPSNTIINTPSPSPSPSATATITPKLTKTITPTPTPLPETITAEFDFSFKPEQISQEFIGFGFDEYKFGVLNKAGGEIDITEIKSKKILPLMDIDNNLFVSTKNIIFFPHPEQIITKENKVLTFSENKSEFGWAGYVDENGILSRKIITLLPFDGATIIGISFSNIDFGKIFAIRITPHGHIVGKVPIFFSSEDKIISKLDGSGIHISINDNTLIPEYSENGWKPEIKQLLAKENIIFPESTTSTLIRDDYGLSINFSEGIFENTGFQQLKKFNGLINIHIREEIMDNWSLQNFGRLMFFQRENNVRYNLFKPLAEQMKEIYSNGSYPSMYGDPVFIDKAREILIDGPVPLRFTHYNDDLAGVINTLQFNFVNKAEFNHLKLILDKNQINYIYHWSVPEYSTGDFGYLIYFENSSLVIYGYHRYNNDQENKIRDYIEFPELAPFGEDMFYYYDSIWNLQLAAFRTLSFMFFSDKDSKTMPNDAGRSYISYSEFTCGGDNCKETVTLTFSP